METYYLYEVTGTDPVGNPVTAVVVAKTSGEAKIRGERTLKGLYRSRSRQLRAGAESASRKARAGLKVERCTGHRMEKLLDDTRFTSPEKTKTGLIAYGTSALIPTSYRGRYGWIL